MGDPAKQVNFFLVLCAFLRPITTQHETSLEDKALLSKMQFATWHRLAGGNLSGWPGQRVNISFVVFAFSRPITTEHEISHMARQSSQESSIP